MHDLRVAQQDSLAEHSGMYEERSYLMRWQVHSSMSGRSRSLNVLGSILQNNGELNEDLNHRIQVRWMKRRSASCMSCDRCMPLNLKGNFYRMTIRPAMLNDRMHTKKDRIKNEDIRGKVGVVAIKYKMRESVKVVWTYEPKTCRALVRKCDYETKAMWGRERPNKILKKALRKDIKYLEDLMHNQAQ
ncbi:hypothetical protein DVH24_000880 [Malus domestica]|uniref:Uncharacterized protein n=1 Tax=Malus domestica TaxID=3750 RepID=A0A498JZN8_MALDO|nr:hypothetical protein DVH24_000880 [Malus domestica]